MSIVWLGVHWLLFIGGYLFFKTKSNLYYKAIEKIKTKNISYFDIENIENKAYKYNKLADDISIILSFVINIIYLLIYFPRYGYNELINFYSSSGFFKSFFASVAIFIHVLFTVSVVAISFDKEDGWIIKLIIKFKNLVDNPLNNIQDKIINKIINKEAKINKKQHNKDYII